MNPSPSSDDPPGALRQPPASSPGEYEALRDLLLGQERQQLQGLKERVEKLNLRAEDVSQVLPQAITLASHRVAPLATALTPAVESALKESVRRDPAPVVNAIFPVMGPAIRRAVAEAFSKLLQSLNQTLDSSFTLQGLKWRFEALRTGRSFAEVVLAHTLIYRVEQVLLIHQHTGLLLLQVRAPHIRGEDAGMVSGLLTAIQDFARDSFHVPAGETLHTVQVGELTVWVETSPGLTLAAVIRGQAPYEFRETLQAALENIHREHAAALDAFDGDAAPFELARPHLETCLRAQFAATRRQPSSRRLIAGVGLALLLLGLWAFFTVRARQRWTGFLERIRSEPGLVVTEAGRRGGKYFVEGLRDPLAAEPAQFLAEFQIRTNQVVSRWKPYLTLDSPLVLQRAILALRPPAGVHLRLHEGVLIAEGQAPAAWIKEVPQRALQVPGIVAFDGSGLADAASALLSDRQRAIEQVVLYFDDGVHLVPGQELLLAQLATQLTDLGHVAAQQDQRLRVSVVGHTDRTGTEDYNQRLSRQRADHVVNLLVGRGVPASGLVAAGLGAKEPGDADATEAASPRSRRVTFHVDFEKTSPSLPPP